MVTGDSDGRHGSRADASPRCPRGRSPVRRDSGEAIVIFEQNHHGLVPHALLCVGLLWVHSMDWVLFLTKKVLSVLVYPLGTALFLWLAGVIRWLFRPRSRAGLLLVCCGALWLLVMSFPVTGFYLLHALEARAGPYADPAALRNKGVKFVVVLGGDLRGGDLTAADRVAYTSLVRLMEGVRLWKAIPGAKLVLSGGTYSSDVMNCAEAMAAMAGQLGVPAEAMILESGSWDTQDEARYLKPILGKDAFAMVTTASHIPRAVMTFAKAGLRPIPAPADFETKRFVLDYRAFLPEARGLVTSQKALHEYFGMMALFMKRLISVSGA